MRNNKLKKVIAIALFTAMVSQVGTSVSALTVNADIDKLYSEAYTASMKALEVKTQKSINEARVSIDEFRKVLPNHNGVPTFSSLVDTVQHPILVNVINKILAVQKKVDTKQRISQAEINEIRVLCEGDYADLTDNMPDVWYAKGGWSQQCDNFQSVIINEIVRLVNEAEKEKNESSVAAARDVINDMKTAYKPNMAEWATGMEVKVNKVVIDEVKPTPPPVEHETIVVSIGKEIALPYAIEKGYTAYLLNTFNYYNYMNSDNKEYWLDDITTIKVIGDGVVNTIVPAKHQTRYNLIIRKDDTKEIKTHIKNYAKTSIGVDTTEAIFNNDNAEISINSKANEDGFVRFVIDTKTGGVGFSVKLSSSDSTEDIAKKVVLSFKDNYTGSYQLESNGNKIILTRLGQVFNKEEIKIFTFGN